MQQVEAGIERVWAIDDGEKIKKEDITNSLSTSPDNPVWDRTKISLFGAKNEIVAFQLIIEADSSGVSGVNVKVTDLVNGSYVIPNSDTGSSDPYDYRGKSIELFTEHYLHIISRSPPGDPGYYTLAAMPSDYYLGWVPDCLIPFAAPAGKGGTPFSIEANMNQGVWIDIYIPRDALQGIYTGNLQVIVNEKITHTIPISLLVYDFTLPDETHFKNIFALNSYGVAVRHGVQSRSPEHYAIEYEYHKMAHRHRFDIMYYTVRNLTQMNNYHKKYLNGELYTSAYRYEGPGENVGNGTFSICVTADEYGGSRDNWSESTWHSATDAWETWFINNAPHVVRHQYLYPDEPNIWGPEKDELINIIRQQCDWTHNNLGPGRNLLCFLTCIIIPELQGYIDFWSVPIGTHLYFNESNIADIRYEQSQENKYGMYNWCRPAGGTMVIDADAIEFRVIPWTAWKCQIDEYFLYMCNLWASNINVFIEPITKVSTGGNGHGTFFYPGQDVFFPEQGRGLPGPLSSIRMKNWRRGMQDYEYLWLAKQLGLETEIEEIVNNCVPTALWEADWRKDISWSSHGYGFEIYRRQLAELIAENIQNTTPVANAGTDRTVVDNDRDGSEPVTLDGSNSKDPDGKIVSFIWSEGGVQIATGVKPSVILSTGTHLITLTVTDNGGLTNTDTVTIKVLKVDREFGELPAGCYNNVSNPTKGKEAIIVVEIKERGYVRIDLYDVKGKKIKELADEEREPGKHRYYWNGRNDNGDVVGSGIYFVHIQAGDYKKTKKIVVVK